MNRGLAIGISIILVVAIGCGGLFFYWHSQRTQNQYNVIAKRWTNAGKFIDYSNDTGVEDASDVMYYIDKEKQEVTILYGYVTLVYSFEEMCSEDWQDKLAYIGITYDIKPNTRDDFKMYWCGEALEKCADKPSVG